MENMQVLLDYSDAYQEYDSYIRNKQNTPTRAKIKENNNVLKGANKKLTEFKNSIEQKTREYEQQVRLAKGLDADLEELEKDISYYSECDDEEFSRREYEEMNKEARRIISENDKIRKKLEELSKTVEKQESDLMKFLSTIRAAQVNLEELKKQYEKEQSVKSDEETALENRLRDLEKKIPENVINEVKRIKTNKAKPVATYDGGRCSGCNMQLPPIYANRIANEDIVYCEHCGRILVIV